MRPAGILFSIRDQNDRKASAEVSVLSSSGRPRSDVFRATRVAAPGRPSVSWRTRTRPGPLHFFEKVRPLLYPTALVIEIGKFDDSSLGMPTRE